MYLGFLIAGTGVPINMLVGECQYAVKQQLGALDDLRVNSEWISFEIVRQRQDAKFFIIYAIISISSNVCFYEAAGVHIHLYDNWVIV